MKTAFTSIVITGFVAVAVFGIFAIGQTNEHEHKGCLAATSQGLNCDESANPFDFISFHLNAFKSFSNATLNSNQILSFILMTLLALGFLMFRKLALEPQTLNPLETLSRKSAVPIQKQIFSKWLTLHEKRADAPSF